MVSKTLTQSLKAKYLPEIIERDGDRCFYCRGKFHKWITKYKREFDHLDNDQTHNDISNIVICHAKCNVEKRTSGDYQIIAKDKLNENLRSAEIQIKSHADTDKETGTEVDSNAVFYEIMKEVLKEKVAKSMISSLKDIVNLATARGYIQVGHCSQITMTRVLDVLTTEEFKWEKFKDEKQRWYVRERIEEGT